jgi:cbb3-type cytochrome oxidase cytochrome c subunit
MKNLLILFCLISAGCAGMNGERQSENSSVQVGADVYKSLGCGGCHSISGKGGKIGPDLTNVGAKRSKEWLAEQIKNPKTINPSSIMPAYKDLSKSDLDALVDFLSSLR